MKKWILSVLLFMIIGICVLLYNGINIDTEDYLNLADTFRERGAYDQELFNLEKALESSIKTNGSVSEVTAEIYRKLANRENNLSKKEEYFDMAIGIYKLENEMKLPELYYEKGYWLINGGSETKEKARDAFKNVIHLYEENEYENSDVLCMSFYFMSFLEEGNEERLLYLKQGENYFSKMSEEQYWEFSTIIERAIGAILFSKAEYDQALSYYETIIKKSENNKSEEVWYITADARALSGACLVFLGNVEEGLSRIKLSITTYQEKNDAFLYSEQASANIYLALAYAYMNPPKVEAALNAGMDAFSLYKQREVITNIDLDKMNNLKYYLSIAYKRIYPESDEKDFEIWFDKNAKVTAYNYKFYTN